MKISARVPHVFFVSIRWSGYINSEFIEFTVESGWGSNKIVEELIKEKAFEEFVKELNESEKKEVDELVSFTYNNT